jgi:predicted DCC family thiol-disulfide oxidoreductase YuxK
MTTPRLTLFYDGACPLCSREIAHYRRRAAGDPAIDFLDITDPSFDAAAHGLDPGRVHRLMHVKVGEEVRVGLDAFLAVWDAVPGYRWLARLARLLGVHLAMNLGYHLFARVRPWLPGRRPCASGACER